MKAQIEKYMEEWLLEQDSSSREAWEEVKTAVFDAVGEVQI